MAFLLFPIKVPKMVVMLIVARIACDHALPKKHLKTIPFIKSFLFATTTYYNIMVYLPTFSEI